MAARVIQLRPYTFRIDNAIIDDYAAELGLEGVGLYAALCRYADRVTDRCWPKATTLAKLFHVSKTTIKKHLRKLQNLGILTIYTRYAPNGKRSSNGYWMHDVTNKDAVQLRRMTQGCGSEIDPYPEPVENSDLGGQNLTVRGSEIDPNQKSLIKLPKKVESEEAWG